MSSSHPSLVHTQQTSAQIDAVPTYGQALRHSCRRRYAAAMVIYTLMDSHDTAFRAIRLRDCRSISWFTRHITTGEVRVATSSCSLRWCPVCSNVRRNYVARSVSEWIQGCPYPKLMTLTLMHTDAPLHFQIEQLYKFFRELRRRKEFKAAVTGGVWFFQIKKSKTDRCWHPHIHAIVTGEFLPRRRLSKIWCEITSGSMVTEIRAVKDPQGAASEVARYATCPGNLAELSPDDGLEMVDALHGLRICGTWGKGRGISLRPKPSIVKEEWTNIGSWQVVMGTQDTDHSAKAILHAWQTGCELSAGITCSRTDEMLERLKNKYQTVYDFESIYEHEREPP